MQFIKSKKNQTIMDIALQVYGDIEGVFWLVEDNNLRGLVDHLDVGQELQIRDTTINDRIRDYLEPYSIATGEEAVGSGIGFWQITNDDSRNNTFCVS